MGTDTIAGRHPAADDPYYNLAGALHDLKAGTNDQVVHRTIERVMGQLKAAGGSTREDERDCSPVGARPQDAQSTPAAAAYQPDFSQPHPSDAAPVCEWTKTGALWIDSHGWVTRERALDSKTCPSCGKPISFKGAAR